MSKQTNKQKKRPPLRSPRQANTVRFPLPCVMLLCWMRSYAGEEECSCGASPDYEIDSFVDAEGLLGAEGPTEKDHLLLSALEQQRNGAFAVYHTFLVCRQHALELFTDLYGEQDAQQALSPLLLGISNLTVTVGREITAAKSPARNAPGVLHECHQRPRSDRSAHWVCRHKDSQKIFRGVVRTSDLSDSLFSTPYGSIWNGLDM